ncbi:transposase [Falsiroseomonas tokyonensis]|uniref:Transposase n=1 Tax=Falsiroseomonas tokyonensis TaxID=430521 RepID=A0ABV7BYF8_9PROT|nr:transposase [Falsiroseomonas tokyonensis]MBU8539088.1 transposase [Falsiroseomonas tokyonensis]
MRLHFPLRPTTPHDWFPLTDSEWAALCDYLPSGIGRPPRDRRKIWNAIFWVACGTDPWAALPKDFCDYGTAHSALIYQARNGTLDRLLIAVSRHPFARPDMASLEWRICRAFRRAARQLSPYSLLLARNLGMESALPGPAELLPETPVPQPGRPDAPYEVPRMPRIPRRTLRGLPPPRLHIPALPPLVDKAPRRPRHLVLRPVRRV